jgi:hypothetical protein
MSDGSPFDPPDSDSSALWPRSVTIFDPTVKGHLLGLPGEETGQVDDSNDFPGRYAGWEIA